MTTATFTVFGAFDNTGKIEELNLCAFVVVDTGYARECCEFVVGGFGERACQLGQESGLADGGKAYHAYTCVASGFYVEAFTTCATTFTTGAVD